MVKEKNMIGTSILGVAVVGFVGFFGISAIIGLLQDIAGFIITLVAWLVAIGFVASLLGM